MNAENGADKELDSTDDDGEDVEDFDSTVVMSDDSVDLSLDETAEIDVDKLVADVEALKRDEKARKQLEARKRLDHLRDELEGDDEFGSTYNFNLDDDDILK